MMFPSYRDISCCAHLHDDYKSQFGSDHMPVVDIVLILHGMPGGVPEISISEKEKFKLKHYFPHNYSWVMYSTCHHYFKSPEVLITLHYMQSI